MKVHFDPIVVDVTHRIVQDESGGATSEVLNQILAQQEALARQMEQLMAGSDKVQIELEKLNTVTTEMANTIDEVVAADQAEDDAFRAEIAALKQQILDGVAISEQQLEALAGTLGEKNTRLSQLSEALKLIGTNPADPLPA